jgi:uncharacterized cupredoxin-like copper-binding protein
MSFGRSQHDFFGPIRPGTPLPRRCFEQTEDPAAGGPDGHHHTHRRAENRVRLPQSRRPTYVEGTVGHDAQTVSFAPSQGGWVEFTLDQEGNYPFVTHAFGDMVKGAAGILHTTGAPAVKGPEAAPKAPAAGHDMASMKADVNTTLGEMWVKADTTSVKAGKVTFAVKNTGATTHGLAIVPAPAKAPGGMLDESVFVAQGKQLAGGESDTVTAELKPGSYQLVCFLPGHFAAGQKLDFQVK